MPEFRKWILALAAVGLFTGFASAQVQNGTVGTTSAGQFTCTTTNGAVTPTLRSDGYTELTGDIVIGCTGGAILSPGSVIPTANITIFLNTAVTSRLLQPTTVGNASEALLMIDEPGSNLQGYGPGQGQILCTNPSFGAGLGGCTEYVGNTTTGGTGAPVSTTPNTTTTGTGCSAAAPCFNPLALSPGPNVFQGVVSGNQVTFFGVPILPPSTVGLSRVFRITNIRANANGVTAGGPTPGSVVASIGISGSTSLPITNSTLTVGFVQPGLNTTNTALRNQPNSGGGGASFNQCNSASITSTSSAVGGLLQFQENFATAFKPRVSSNVTTFSGGYPAQNVPGQIYNSESGFIFPLAVQTGSTNGLTEVAGLADYATRLKAVFNNVPSGVSIWVSTRDVTNAFVAYGGTANAVLVVNENAPDGSVGNIPVAAQTSNAPSGFSLTSAGSGASLPGIAPVVISNGTGTATWEVINSNPATIDTDVFAVYLAYSASPANNTPSAPSALSVTMEFAPTPSGGQFTSSTGAAASNSFTIPRFSDSLAITKTYASFVLCTTNLLYPYVINTNGFDTGLAIANTTMDPFGTAAQVGTCALNFYGGSAPSAAFTTPSIASGTVYANLASTLAPGFSGYIIAVCNFQFAHGFAFVSDVGARNLAMGYLALIIPSSNRSAAENLNN